MHFLFDGPYEPAKGTSVLTRKMSFLDPIFQSGHWTAKWGEKPEGGKDFEYRARVVKSSF